MGRVKITWEEEQELYPNIGQIFGGQFHEDAEGETEEILNREIFREYSSNRLEAAIEEMNLLQEKYPLEADLSSAVGGQFGARWIDPDATYSIWLDRLKALFKKEIKRRQDNNLTEIPY